MLMGTQVRGTSSVTCDNNVDGWTCGDADENVFSHKGRQTRVSTRNENVSGHVDEETSGRGVINMSQRVENVDGDTGRNAEARPEMKKKEDLRKTTPRKKGWKKKMPGRENGGNSPMAKSFARKLDLKPNLSVKQMAARLETFQHINLSTTKI